jgi:hypothetical protein
MRKSLLCIAFAIAVLATGGAAHSAMQKNEKPSVFTHVEPVICEGRRRNYRSFRQCVRLRGARRANYCGRICL